MRPGLVAATVLIVAGGATPLIDTALARPPTVHVKCRDGGGAHAEGFGARRDLLDACDVDRTCDGRCTFLLPNRCISCLLKAVPRRSKPACHSCDGFGWQQCPPLVSAVVLSSSPREQRRVEIENEDGREGSIVYKLSCRSDERCAALTTTTTLPTPDFAGSWTFVVSDTSHDCPPALPATIPTAFPGPEPFAIHIMQTGSDVAACRNRGLPYVSGSLTASGWRFERRFSVGFEEHLWDVSETLAAGPAEGGDLPARLSFELNEIHDGPAVCSIQMSGTLVPTGCADDQSCMASDPCTRCIGGRCRPLPRCRWESACTAAHKKCWTGP